MTTSQLIAGRWVLPTVESNQDGTVRMHVSVSVDSIDALADIPVEVGLSAAGQPLDLAEAPSSWYYLETLAITAVSDLAFANPAGADPDACTVTMQGESATFEVTVRPAEPEIPMV
ncbi:MAG TPA: hypothetical protein PKZ38_08460 [Dermatophilaceae bacterium]|jgi:hypothetical protein|nr:hypothetical protein [Dermatophilaceae bacterium]